jgi:hypothetical protein
MSEWIKFDFDMLSETVACDLVVYVDDVLLKSRHIGTDVDYFDPSEGRESKKATIWVELDDDMVNGTGDHSIRINVVERLDADNGTPIHEYPMIEMSGVELSGSAHIPAEGNINTSIKVYNILDDAYQALIDGGETKHDNQVTEDIGDGDRVYSISNWDNYQVIGNGAWVLEFTCPYLTWYDGVHAD